MPLPMSVLFKCIMAVSSSMWQYSEYKNNPVISFVLILCVVLIHEWFTMNVPFFFDQQTMPLLCIDIEITQKCRLSVHFVLHRMKIITFVHVLPRSINTKVIDLAKTMNESNGIKLGREERWKWVKVFNKIDNLKFAVKGKDWYYWKCCTKIAWKHPI